jgi:phosphoserine phosphatase
MKQPKKLYIFDMDGTLLPKTTACLEIAKIMKKSHLIEHMEVKLKNKEMCDKQFGNEIYNLWGAPDPLIVRQAFENSPKLKNIKQTLQHIKSEDHVSCLITMSPQYFAHHFYEYGFDHIFSSVLPASSEEAFDTSKLLSPMDKLHIIKDLAEKIGVSLKNSIAFGDSRSDLHIMSELQETVSVNGDEHIIDLCKYKYAGDDLWEAYQMTAKAVSV